LRRQISPAYPVRPFPMFFGMFFRPEEDALFSECVDDALFFDFEEVDFGNKNDRLAFLIFYKKLQVAVDLDFHGLLAVRAFRVDRDLQRLVS
jgi:hypothetical protein